MCHMHCWVVYSSLLRSFLSLGRMCCMAPWQLAHTTPPQQETSPLRYQAVCVVDSAASSEICTEDKSRAGVPIQLWADRRREDAHNAGQQGAGWAGHHPQGYPEGLPTPHRLHFHAQMRMSVCELRRVVMPPPYLYVFGKPENTEPHAGVHPNIILHCLLCTGNSWI